MYCACEGHDFGFEPPEDLSDPMFAPNQALTVGGGRFPIRRVSKQYCVEQMENEPIVCFLYGRITYWDTFTDRKAPDAKPHVTQWIYTYDVGGEGFRRYASNYTKHT